MGRTMAAIAIACTIAAPVGADPLACGGERIGRRLIVSQDTARCAWPFTVARVQLACIGPRDRLAVVASNGGADYALNGNARERAGELGLRDPAGILRQKNAAVGDWIAAAAKACL